MIAWKYISAELDFRRSFQSSDMNFFWVYSLLILSVAEPCRDPDMIETVGCLRVAVLLKQLDSVDLLSSRLGLRDPAFEVKRYHTRADALLISASVQEWLDATAESSRTEPEARLKHLAVTCGRAPVQAAVDEEVQVLQQRIKFGTRQGAHESLSQSLAALERSQVLLEEARRDFAIARDELSRWKIVPAGERENLEMLMRKFAKYKVYADWAHSTKVAIGSHQRARFDALFKTIVDSPAAEAAHKTPQLTEYLRNLQLDGMNAQSLWTLCQPAHKLLHSRLFVGPSVLASTVRLTTDRFAACTAECREIEKLVAFKQARLDALKTNR